MSRYLRILPFGSLCLLGCLCVWASQAESTKPRYPKKVERPRPPVGPDGKPLVTVDGRWYSDFGYMDLVQDQWTFEGTYSCCAGKIRGELIADQIEFFWDDVVYGKGWGYFRWGNQGRQLLGVWGTEADMGSSGAWKGVRLEQRSYEGEGGPWSFTALHPQIGEIRGEAELWFSGDAVAGQLEGAAETASKAYPEGKLYRHEIFRYLEGRVEGDELSLEWRNPLTEHEGEIRLTRSGDELAGTWYASEEIEVPITLKRSPENAAPESP